MAKKYFNIDNDKLINNNPKMNKIGKDLFVHWFLMNLIKTKNIKMSIKENKVTLNLKKVLEKKVFNVLRYDIEKNNYVKTLFTNLACIEKNTDVITNNIIFRIFDTIEAQENLGFIRETRFSYERLKDKIENLNIDKFIENKKPNKNDVIEIIKIYEYIYKNNIHNKILELNETINKKNLDKTLKLLKTIPFIDDYKAYLILIDLTKYSFYKFDIENYVFLRKEILFTLKELFDFYDGLDFDELLYWLFINQTKIINEFYEGFSYKFDLYDLDVMLYDLSFIIKRIYNDNFDGEFLSNIDMGSINPQNRSKNSEEYHVKMADGRCLDF